jgi:plasmid maintenance system antidote protein VapI
MSDERRPVEVFPARDYVDDELSARGLTFDEFAAGIGVDPTALAERCSGNEPLTAGWAAKFATYFGVSAETWMRIAMTYRKYIGEQELCDCDAALPDGECPNCAFGPTEPTKQKARVR